jgi:hypothetical protein
LFVTAAESSDWTIKAHLLHPFSTITWPSLTKALDEITTTNVMQRYFCADFDKRAFLGNFNIIDVIRTARRKAIELAMLGMIERAHQILTLLPTYARLETGDKKEDEVDMAAIEIFYRVTGLPRPDGEHMPESDGIARATTERLLVSRFGSPRRNREASLLDQKGYSYMQTCLEENSAENYNTNDDADTLRQDLDTCKRAKLRVKYFYAVLVLKRGKDSMKQHEEEEKWRELAARDLQLYEQGECLSLVFDAWRSH